MLYNRDEKAISETKENLIGSNPASRREDLSREDRGLDCSETSQRIVYEMFSSSLVSNMYLRE